MEYKVQKHLVINGLSLLLAVTGAYSYGIRVDDMDALATARGNAFTATADNPSAVYYNPSGITQIDSPALSVGGYSLRFEVDYRNMDGEKFTNDREFQGVPHVYFTLPIETTPLTFGFTTHVPFGLENDWPDDTTFSTIATESSFRYIRHSPVIAWEINPQWSVAAGLTINDGKADLRRTHPSPFIDEVRLEGRDQTFGYVVGAHWRPSERHYFGAIYRSRTTFDLEGTMTVGEDRTRAVAEFPFPDIAVIGYSYRPTEAWNLEFNLDWTNWDVLDTVSVETEDFGDSDMDFNWKSSLIYKFGVTHTLPSGYRLSAGYMFSENSIPDRNFSPSVPDSDRHLASIGVGYVEDRFHWDIAYQFGYSTTRNVRDSENPPPAGFPAPIETADGEYRSIVHAVAATATYRF